MKKILLLMVIMSMFSCQSKDGKINELIEKDLYGRLVDFKSYEPIETSKKEELYSSPYDDQTIYDLADEVISCEAGKKSSKFMIDLNKTYVDSYKDDRSSFGKSMYQRYKEDMDKQQSKYDSLLNCELKTKKLLVEACSKFKKEKIGWSVVHKFRAKNKLGISTIANFKYKFDNDIKEIKSVVDLDNEIKEEGVIARIDSAFAGFY